MSKNMRPIILLCIMLHTLFCADESIDQQASQSTVTRHYYVHHNQLRQQLLNITGPGYNAQNMNLGALYQLIANDGNLSPLSTLVNSPTCGNVTLGSIVNSPTMGNLALATILATMQNYAYLTATNFTTFAISAQNPAGLVSTNGTTITFNVAGMYMLAGSFVGSATTSGAYTLSDNCSNGNPTSYNITGVSNFGTIRIPMTFPYTALHTVQAGDTIAFSKSSNWNMFSSSTITINIIRIS